MNKNFVVGVVLVVTSAFVFAQTKVDQGRPGTQGPWPVSLLGSGDGGSVSVTVSGTVKVAGPDGGYIQVGGSVYVTTDGGSIPVTGTVNVITSALLIPADGGYTVHTNTVSSAPYQCGSTSQHTSYLMDAGALVVGSLTQRVYTSVCNSRDNSSGLIRCRADGVNPTTVAGSPGSVLNPGDCVVFTNPGGRPIYCIGSSTYVTAYECAP